MNHPYLKEKEKSPSDDNPLYLIGMESYKLNEEINLEPKIELKIEENLPPPFRVLSLNIIPIRKNQVLALHKLACYIEESNPKESFALNIQVVKEINILIKSMKYWQGFDEQDIVSLQDLLQNLIKKLLSIQKNILYQDNIDQLPLIIFSFTIKKMCIEGAVHEKNNNYSEALKNYNNSLLCLKYVEELTDKINSFHLDSHPSLTFHINQVVMRIKICECKDSII